MATSAGGASPQTQHSLAITRVTVIDLVSGERRADQTVVVSGDSIVAVGAARETAVPRGAQIVDGRGKVVMPGLWDMHVHVTSAGRGALDLLLANGVTGVRDMGGDAALVIGWRDSIAAGSLGGPRIRAAGTVVETGRWIDAVRGMIAGRGLDLDRDLAGRLRLDSVPDAARLVDSLHALRVDFIKIRNFPLFATYAAFTTAARRRGLVVVGHAPPNLRYLAAAVDSGFGSIEHLVLVVRDGVARGAFDTLSPDARASFFARLAHAGTAYTPTLVAGRARAVPDSVVRDWIGDDPRGRTGPLTWTSPQLLAAWREQAALSAADAPIDWRPAHAAARRDTWEMAAAGVPILAGTDLGVIGAVPGFALHEELRLLVREARLTPLQALRAATLNPAVVLRDERIGRVAPGAYGDLLLLDADPLTEITNVVRPRAVVTRGRLLDRRDLDRMLERARQHP